MTDLVQLELRLTQLETATTGALEAVVLCIAAGLRELQPPARQAFHRAVEAQWERFHRAAETNPTAAIAEGMLASLLSSLDEQK
jgi:hypothetical protein